MKLLITLAIATASSLSYADSFHIDKDGVDYLCQPAAPTTPGGAAACADAAYQGQFSKDESLQLCRGARNLAPVDCAMKAYEGPYSKFEVIQLCVGARTVGPADCVAKAYEGPFTKQESLTLCSNNGSVENAECAIKAYSGPYSKDEALKLCHQNPQLPLRLLNQLLSTSPVMQLRLKALSTQNLRRLSELK